MLQYSIFKFLIQFETEAKLPKYKGAMLRSALGKNLKNISCPLKHINCEQCILSSSCVYYSFFESKVIMSANTTTSPNTPLPFVIEILDLDKTHYNELESLNFNILVFGDSKKYIPYLIYAVINMGKSGIGFDIKSGFGKFKLISVYHHDTLIYHNTKNQISSEYIPYKLDLSDFKKNTSKIKITFLSPFRTKFKNKLATKHDFEIIIRSSLRRISQLESHFFLNEPAIDYKKLVYKAKSITKVHEQKNWFEVQRYSFRQKNKMKLGGIIGEAIYEGDIGMFYPILKYGEIVHIGKQTSFGFGKFVLETLD